MKTISYRTLLCLAVLGAPVFAQGQAEVPVTDEATGETRSVPLLTAEQLDELLGPIALYPDALIALILPASTMPTDLVLASRYIAAGNDTAKVDEQPWDESVQALARYPDVVTWMDDKLSWSIMVGDAFVAQPVDVMQSIQRLRAKARAAGTLVDSAEQSVVEEEGSIRIVPAQPEVIYVPVYDPAVVYVPRSSSWGWGTSLISYRWCYPTGVWLSYDCDWYNHRIWVVNTHWRHSWYHDRVWWRHSHPRRHHYRHDHDYGHDWSPRHRHHRDRWDGRHDRRDRDRRVVRDERPDYPSMPRAGGFGSSTNRSRDDDSRRVRSDDSDRREGRGNTIVRRDETPRTERRRDDTPRLTPRPDTPRVERPSAPPVVSRPSEPSRTRPSSGRWIDRATNPSQNRNRSEANVSRVRQESSAPRVAPAPAPRSAPRVSPPPTKTTQERPASVRIPLPGGGSRAVGMRPSRQSESRSEASAPRSARPQRGSDGGGEKRAERRKSTSG